MLTVGADEPNNSIPVTATATYIDPAHPEVPNTVSAALDVPIVGDGFVGGLTPTIATELYVTAEDGDPSPSIKSGQRVSLVVQARHKNGKGFYSSLGYVTDNTQFVLTSGEQYGTLDGNEILGRAAGTIRVLAKWQGIEQAITVKVVD